MNHLRYALPLLLLALSLFAASQPNNSGQSNAIDSLQNIIREDRRDIAEARALNVLASNSWTVQRLLWEKWMISSGPLTPGTTPWTNCSAE